MLRPRLFLVYALLLCAVSVIIVMMVAPDTQTCFPLLLLGLPLYVAFALFQREMGDLEE